MELRVEVQEAEVHLGLAGVVDPVTATGLGTAGAQGISRDPAPGLPGYRGQEDGEESARPRRSGPRAVGGEPGGGRPQALLQKDF